MISGQNPPKLTYLGPNTESFNKKAQIDSYEEMLIIVLHNMKFNLKHDIKNSCIDICDFSFTANFFKEAIEEESESVSEVIEEINQIRAKHESKIFIYVGKDYFLGTQLEPVKESTISLLKRLSAILDLIGINYPSIMVRIGSAYGNRKSTMDLFCERTLSLGPDVISKMCVMNDDKPSLFSVTDLLSGIYYKTKIPICFRILPHQFNDGGLTIREALFLSCSTWKEGQKPVFIHSESSEVDESGLPLTSKPSEYLKHRIPTFGLDLDVIIDSPANEDSCLKYLMDYRSLPPIVINKNQKK
jgi:UV DNA damage repair endonuclease